MIVLSLAAPRDGHPLFQFLFAARSEHLLLNRDRPGSMLLFELTRLNVLYVSLRFRPVARWRGRTPAHIPLVGCRAPTGSSAFCRVRRTYVHFLYPRVPWPCVFTIPLHNGAVDELDPVSGLCPRCWSDRPGNLLWGFFFFFFQCFPAPWQYLEPPSVCRRIPLSDVFPLTDESKFAFRQSSELPFPLHL